MSCRTSIPDNDEVFIEDPTETIAFLLLKRGESEGPEFLALSTVRKNPTESLNFKQPTCSCKTIIIEIRSSSYARAKISGAMVAFTGFQISIFICHSRCVETPYDTTMKRDWLVIQRLPNHKNCAGRIFIVGTPPRYSEIHACLHRLCNRKGRMSNDSRITPCSVVPEPVEDHDALSNRFIPSVDEM
jgi:hypothetical protein